MAASNTNRSNISDYIPEITEPRAFIHNAVSVPKTSNSKTLVIPGFSDTRISDADTSLGLWEILEMAVLKILADNPPDSGYAELYDGVDELCRQAQQRKMIDCLKKMIETYFGSKINEISVILSPNSYRDLLLLYQSFQVKVSNICKIFTVLDRNYLLHDNSATSLMSMSLDIFSRKLSQNGELLNYTISCLLTLIEKMRIGETTDTQLIASFVRMLVDLHFYTTLFETPFLDKTRSFYATESQRNINKPIANFLKNVAFRIKFEENDVCSLISPATHVKLVQIVKWESFGEHFPINLKKGFFKLLDDLQVEDIRLVYSLALQVKDGAETLNANITSYIKTRVSDLMGQSSSQPDFEVQLIQTLILLRENLFSVILPCFNNDSTITRLIEASCNNALESKPIKFMEYFAKFIDVMMRKIKGVNDPYFVKSVPQIISLFKSVYNKEVFINQHRVLLAERLIDLKSNSIECEKSLVEELKLELGSEFTSKIDGMFRDIHESQMISSNFNQVERCLPLESSIIFLSQGLWPPYDCPVFSVPQPIATRMCEYTEYYKDCEKSKRHLTWPLSLSTCVVTVNFTKGKKELDINFLEAIILDIFNNLNTLSVLEISKALNILRPCDLADLDAAILTLACGNFKILLKEPAGLKITPSDKITFNTDFQHELFRIKITRFSVSPDASTGSRVEPIEYLEQQARIQSIIVFSIKRKKRLSIREIIELVIGSRKCIATEAEVKTQIDNLVTKEYIRQDPDHSDHYIFIT